MRPASIHGLPPRNTGIAFLCLLLAGCGQTGALYLVAPRSTAPMATTRVAPASITKTSPPSAATHGQP